KAPGACVLEPQLGDRAQPGALLPKNWLRPRFRFTPLAGENLWEIRLKAASQVHELRVYTTRPGYELPRAMWKGLAIHSPDLEVRVPIRGLNGTARGEPSGTRGSFTIAPVEARGKMVYWATTSSEVMPNTSKLVGFDVGDEGVIDALTVPGAGDRAILGSGG